MFGSLFSTQRRLREAHIPVLAQVTPSPWRQAWRALRQNRLAMFCLVLLLVMAVRLDTLGLVDVVRDGKVEQRTRGNANDQFLFDGVGH